MKKITFVIILFFSIPSLIAQTNCNDGLGIFLNTTITAPGFINETGTPPNLFCGLNNNNALPTKGKWYKFTPHN